MSDDRSLSGDILTLYLSIYIGVVVISEISYLLKQYYKACILSFVLLGWILGYLYYNSRLVFSNIIIILGCANTNNVPCPTLYPWMGCDDESISNTNFREIE